MTNRPKGKLFALLAIFVAIGLVTATGAFTSVTAERTAQVSVAGDSSALLQLSQPSSMPAGSVTFDNGVAEIDLTSSGLGTGVDGINPNATTVLSPLMNVTNNANEDLNVSYTVGVSNATTVTASNVTIVDAGGSAITGGTVLGTGNTTQFGLKFDLTGIDTSAETAFTVDITITADDADGS